MNNKSENNYNLSDFPDGTSDSKTPSRNQASRTFHTHSFGPLFDQNSRILILGSFPSVRSREEGFYYGHPRNRFWSLIALLTKEPVPETIDQKRTLLLKHQIALWDSIESCEINGSSDSSIRKITPTKIERITDSCQIRKILCNGATSWKYYNRYLKPVTGIEAVKLPSTSPANAAWSMERLLKTWSDAFQET